jgi:TRAP transporter TAXI family solute receptor
MRRNHRGGSRLRGITACIGLAVLACASGPARTQTYGLATMQPGTLAHATGSAIAKVLKEKGGLNTLVQTTAGESVLIPMVARGEIDLGIANLAEVQAAAEGTPPPQPDLRLIGTIHPLRTAFWVRKDAPIQSIADLKGKRVPLGYSAMRTVDMLTQAQLALGGLTADDVKPVLVPNVTRGADDFIAGAADALYFAFGGPKVREADATVGGIRVLAIPESPENLAASRKLFPYGYLTQVMPIPLYVGVTRPMQVYTFDYMLFTSVKTKDDAVYRMIDTLVNNKADLAAIAPHLQEFSAAALYKKFNMPYHAGALKYFADHNIPAVEIR